MLALSGAVGLERGPKSVRNPVFLFSTGETKSEGDVQWCFTMFNVFL